jgi:arylsulfatase
MDDMGYSDLGCYGGEITLQNIDRLARDGVRYIRFDTNAICSATRASLLTGRNSQTVKMGFLAAMDLTKLPMSAGGNTVSLSASTWILFPANRDSGPLKEMFKINPGWRDPNVQSPDRGWMPENVETLAQALKTTGYANWVIGKWHLAPEWEDGTIGETISTWQHYRRAS